MKPFVVALVGAGMLATGGSGFAQTSQGTAPTGSSPKLSPANVPGSTAAAGDNNQAVATTTANAAQPAKGANSFTMAEAKGRLEKSGFSDVGNLTKDQNGVWHGNAQKNGNSTQVWLDYKGNVGQSK